jgi:nucleotide-binding universal stress UspA family protein
MKDHSRILVPLDGSSLAECVLPHVVALSRIFDSPITLLRVVGGESEYGGSRAVDPLSWQISKTEAEAYLAEVATRLRDLDLEVVTSVVEGLAAERIVTSSSEIEAGLIVMSSHGRSGLSEWNINSVVQKVLLRVYVPALIVRAYRSQNIGLDELRYRTLMVPLDGSQRAECVLPLASMIAQGHNARLMVAHIVRDPEMPRWRPLNEEERKLADRVIEINRDEAARYLDDLSSRLSGDVETRLLVAESPAAALHQLASDESVDMILLCAHGYSGAAQWPHGSVTLNFVAYGDTPLLVMQDMSESEASPSVAEEAASESKGH